MSASLYNACVPASLGVPIVFGAEILSIEATLVTNYNVSAPEMFRFTQPSVVAHNLTFCNITVSYTHPGENDNILVEAWLPADNWNGKLQAVGGGGYVAGRSFLSYSAMNGAIADGYATITTDAGLGAASDATPWALISPGNVNLYNLRNLGAVSLNDEAIIGKSLIKSFYGRAPDYSYWNGCSQGGRQGLMLAQRYPTAYDGIVAAAPALYWNQLLVSIFWPQQFMNVLGSYPRGCELEAISAAAVAACDGLDGVVDGIIAEVDACLAKFDPFQLVGTTVKNCTQAGGDTVRISRAAAAVVNATWNGMATVDGEPVWYGLNPGADITGALLGFGAVAATKCADGNCHGAPSDLGTVWLQLFLAKNPDFDFSSLTHAEFDFLTHTGTNEYGSFINTDDADLSAFRDAGGKLVSFHGLNDQLIPPKGTEKYYNDVTALLPDVHDFYRHFEIPGLAHCWGPPSSQPTGLFEQLRAWVENGTAPESSPVKIVDLEGKTQERILCPYPKKAQFVKSCGDVAVADCWSCVERSTASSKFEDVYIHEEL